MSESIFCPHCGGQLREIYEVKWKGWSLNLLSGELYVGEKKINLTPMESKILSILIARNGNIVPLERILLRMYYDKRDMAEGKIVDVLICRVKKKLENVGLERNLVHNIWGRGWMVEPIIEEPVNND